MKGRLLARVRRRRGDELRVSLAARRDGSAYAVVAYLPFDAAAGTVRSVPHAVVYVQPQELRLVIAGLEKAVDALAHLDPPAARPRAEGQR